MPPPTLRCARLLSGLLELLRSTAVAMPCGPRSAARQPVTTRSPLSCVTLFTTRRYAEAIPLIAAV